MFILMMKYVIFNLRTTKSEDCENSCQIRNSNDPEFRQILIKWVILNCEFRHLLKGRDCRKLMFRKPSDVIVTTEVKARRHETTLAADTMVFKKGCFPKDNVQTPVLLIGLSLVYLTSQLINY